MDESIDRLRREGLARIAAAGSASELEAVRVALLGRRSELTVRLRGLKELPAAERPVAGDALNRVKDEFTAALAGKILPHQQNFLFLDEVLLWYTADIAFAPVVHLPAKYRKSSYSVADLFRLFANLVLYYTMVPLKVLVYGGFLVSFVTFFVGLWFIIKKMVYNVPLGYTSLIVTVLFSTSIILFSLGVLGEYLSRIYQVQNRKPPYSVRTVTE